MRDDSGFSQGAGAQHPLRRASDFPRASARRFADILPFVAIACATFGLLLGIVLLLDLFPGTVTPIRIQVGERKAIDSEVAAKSVSVSGRKGVKAEVVDGQVQIEAVERTVSDVNVRWADGRLQRYVVVAGAPVVPMWVNRISVMRPEQLAEMRMRAKPVPLVVKKIEELRKKEPVVKLIDVKPPVEEEKKDDTKPDGQVIEMQQPLVEKRPEKSKYVSEFDSTVAKEMKSRHRKLPPTPAGPPMEARENRERVAKQPQEKPKVARREKRPKVEARAKVEEKKAFETIPEPEREKRRYALLDRQLKLDPQGALPRIEESQPKKAVRSQRPTEGTAKQDPREAEGDDGEPETVHDVRDLMPSREALKSIAGAPVNDHLKGVDEGDRDMLNSRSWKFASFFNRVKRGVAQQWKPGPAYIRRDPNGNVYGLKDRYTVLHVTLDQGGGLKEVRVHQESGLEFLDREAIRAFHEAQPFPNPPKGLLDRQGQIGFLFGFYFEISSRPQFRIFRYAN